ncbi:uncharacterized protein LOC124893464, partial [Capsicum annuum]|uniref:uncharacterized protein LOC124893464 n=1 Tax=Capsicum annuum TaxID=4072 RepID=UPI001FB0A897
MEQLVLDMLRDGIIQPITSPFSSPVLLVRKKAGFWHFCVDYRALNAITVRDRFSIPFINELFDELYGAQFFSKLDLLSGYHQIRWAEPKTVKEVRSFLGLVGSTPVLALPNFDDDFHVETDASGIGIGTILSQKGHPTAYYSQKLSPQMQKASTYHRKMYAITQAVVTQTPEQQKWLGKLVGYDFTIRYRSGRQNKAADALSRPPDAGVLFAISELTYEWLGELLEVNKCHPELLSVQQGLGSEPAAYADYTFRKGLLFYKGSLGAMLESLVLFIVWPRIFIGLQCVMMLRFTLLRARLVSILRTLIDCQQ